MKLFDLFKDQKEFLGILAMRGAGLITSISLMKNLDQFTSTESKILSVALLILGMDFGNFYYYLTPAKLETKRGLKRYHLSIVCILILSMLIMFNSNVNNLTAFEWLLLPSIYSISFGILFASITRSASVKGIAIYLAFVLAALAASFLNLFNPIAYWLFFLSPVVSLIVLKERVSLALFEKLSFEQIKNGFSSSLSSGMSVVLISSAVANVGFSSFALYVRIVIAITTVLALAQSTSIVKASNSFEKVKITWKLMCIAGAGNVFLATFFLNIYNSQISDFRGGYIIFVSFLSCMMIFRNGMLLMKITNPSNNNSGNEFLFLSLFGLGLNLILGFLDNAIYYLSSAFVFEAVLIWITKPKNESDAVI